jgi:hypothetical protein
VRYYLSQNDPTHGQPPGIDTGALIFNPPILDSEMTCGGWIQASVDNISGNISGIANIVQTDTYMWTKLQNRGHIGIRGAYTYGRDMDYAEYVEPGTAFEWLNVNLSFSYWIYDVNRWYGFTLKLYGSDGTWQINTTQPSYIDINYLFTESPRIDNVTNQNVSIYSATSPANNINNATIVLEGTGSTGITIQMPNASISNYRAIYDGIACNSSNCNFTQSSGQLIFSLNLGSEHTLNIEGNNAPDVPQLNSPTNASTVTGSVVLLNATISDPDTSTVTAWFYGDGALLNTTSNVTNGSTLTYIWTGLSAGSAHTWSVVAGDGVSNTSSATYSFTVASSSGSGGSGSTSNTPDLTKDFNCTNKSLVVLAMGGSAPIPGLSIRLFNDASGEFVFASTNADGAASFEIMNDGSYAIDSMQTSSYGAASIASFTLAICNNASNGSRPVNATNSTNASMQPGATPPEPGTSPPGGSSAGGATAQKLEAELAVRHAEIYIAEAARQGKYVASALSKLAEAQNALTHGNYEEAERLAKQAEGEVKDMPTTVSKEGQPGVNGAQNGAAQQPAENKSGFDLIGAIIGISFTIVLALALALVIGRMMKGKQEQS